MASQTVTESPQKLISRGIVLIYKDYLGRGPTTSRTTITDSFVTTILEDSMTKAERTLVDRGDEDIVRTFRRRFQLAMSRDIIALIEDVTGRRGRTMLSDHDVQNDIAVEMVVYEDATGANGSEPSTGDATP